MNLPFPHLFLRPPAEDEEGWKYALRAEFRLRGGRGEGPRRPLRSLFVAAGARGSDASMAQDVLEVVGGDVVGPATEWTMEVEVPGTGIACSVEAIGTWGYTGVNRVSLAPPPDSPGAGVSAQETPAVPFQARLESLVATARRLLSGGIPMVSVDIPLDTGRGGGERGLQEALRTAHALERIGVPQLAIREADGREEGDGEGGWPSLRDHLLESGYDSGDGIHFVRGGAGAVHPRAILRREPVLGLGPAAVTFRNPERRANVPEWREYRSRTLQGRDPLEWRERLTREEVRTERVWSRLRGIEGLRVRGMGPRSTQCIREWVVQGWATVKGGRVVLLPQGWMRMDGLVVDLLRKEDLDRRTSPGPPI